MPIGRIIAGSAARLFFAAMLLIGGTVTASHAQSGAIDPSLVGEWRYTTVDLEESVDERIVLTANGVFQNWTQRADWRSKTTTGNWRAANKVLLLRASGAQEEGGVPYTFHNGTLVLPNIPNQRKFWVRVR